LLIDLPPGTGDVQLTLAQQASLSGAIIVTTPQDVALGIARKGLKMFQTVHVPILGIVENMSGFFCRKCGEKNAIFKEGGGEKMALDLGVPYLGAIPLDPDVVAGGDAGEPVLVQSRNSPAAQAFTKIADRFKAELARAAGALGEPRDLRVGAQGEMMLTWPDNHQSLYTPYHLRVNCGCAACVHEDTGQRMMDPKNVPLDIRFERANPVGRYGLALAFSDGHSTGIYTFENLRALCECPECTAKRGENAAFSV
jgi:ATP-binding protein involved in chromosome partitioning